MRRPLPSLRTLFRWTLGTIVCLSVAAATWSDTIWFRSPSRAWNGRIIDDPADFHFKYRAQEPGYFEFDRGSTNSRIGLNRSYPNILRIEKNENYGEEEVEGGPGGPTVAEATGAPSPVPGGPAGPFANLDTTRSAEKLEVVATRDWLYPADSEIPLRAGNVVPPQTAVRTPPNSRVKLGYKQIIFIGMMPATQLHVNGLARESQTGIYQLDLSVDPGGEIWLNVTDKIRLSDRVRFIVNGITFDTRSTLINVEVTAQNEVVVSNFGLTELVVSVQGDRVALTGTQQVNLSQPSSQPVPSTKKRADWDNWEIWTPEKISYAPQVYAEVNVSGNAYSDFAVVRVGEVGDLPKTVPVQPQGTMQVIQAWRQGIFDYINQEGFPPPKDQGMEAGLEAVRAKVSALNSALSALPTRDNWGHPFVWKVIVQGTTNLIDVHSIGPNGIDDFGLGDDL